jgi:hypothetical protein
MIANGLGHIAVPTPGTPVLLSAVLTSLGLDPETRAARVYFTPLGGDVGKTYVGIPGMNKTTGVGVLKQLQIPPANGFNDTFVLENADDSVNSIRLASLAIDADTANDKLTVSYVQG